MGVIRKKNPLTGEWEVYGSTEAKDINLIDVGDNFSDKNVEGALREMSDKLSETLADLNAHNSTLIKHSSEIAWLKEHGGGGGGGTGVSAPTITSTFESCSIDKEQEVNIPIFFASPNLGEGTAYLIVNNVEVASISGIKQGNNTIEVGKLTELTNTISIYVKDRANLLSNQLTWQVNIGGIDLSIDFDDTADYYVSDMIIMQYEVASTTNQPIKMHMKIDYDEFTIDCKTGFNEYIFPQLGVGVHNVELYVTDGTYSSPLRKFNVVVVNSASLYISSTFEGGEFILGDPIQVQYRVSKASDEYFNVNLYLNGKLKKTLSCNPGTYYWTLNDLDVGEYEVMVEVSGAYDDTKTLTRNFTVITSGYQPLKVTEDGLLYRLCAKGRTNQDIDKANPIDDSGRENVTTLHNFNWFSNGWIDGELLCDGEAYVEIDCFPWKDNALYGSTIEIQYTALDIGKNDARIIDYTDIETPYKGFYVDIEEAAMNSLANEGKVYTDRDVEMTLSFVIDRRNKFAKIYINGVCSRAFSLADTGSGTAAVREDFTHEQKIYLNSKKGLSNYGACKIKDVRVYGRVLSDDEIVSNYIAQIENLREQEKMYNFNFNNTTLPVIRMYGDTTNMTLETPVTMRIKYSSPNEDYYGQSFDLPYCQVNWQGTSSLQYVLKNFTARLKDENMAPYDYSPYVNGVKEDVYCFKADYMESTHARNVGIAKFVNDCLYDTKNPLQLQNPNIRNSINGFPALLYINDELQGVYNFNLDRYSTKSFGYTDPDKVLVYEISANSDTTAGAFYSWSPSSGKDEWSYYRSDFECVYPPTRAAGNDSLSELKRLIEWVDKSSDEDFKDNIGKYFNLEYLLRYYLTVLVFGMVDSLGKNAKITSFDGGLTWYFQFYDADTSCGLNNSGFLLFGTDIEMGDLNVFNTTGSRLWQRVVYLFQDELKAQYSLMRQGRFTVENIMKYFYDEQISQIPATFYNKDMQNKYLNFGSAYLYALHGSGETHLKKWIRERLMYVDTLLGYMVSSSDYITIRSNKLGYVYLDIEMYIPMYVTVKWRDEANNAGVQTKRVGKGEKVRFEYNVPTETDQEILVYAGHYIKSLGDLSNLQPSTLLISNANRLTEIKCHSSKLINTDLSECILLQKIDISNCTALGTGIGAQPILNIEKSKYLKYLDCRNTAITAIYTMQSGSNLEEVYYPETIQEIALRNQAYLKIIGIPFEKDENGLVTKYCKNLASITIDTCKNVDYLSYPYEEGDYVNLDPIKQVQDLVLIDSLDKLKGMDFNGFSKLKNLTLSTMHNIATLGFDDMLKYGDIASLESIRVADCPLINTISFNISDGSYKVEFVEGAIIDLGGVQSVTAIESNASIKGLKTVIIPTSLKELKFIPGFGDGINDIVNVWSAASSHAIDGYEGMDLLDVTLEFLDMDKLTNVERAINFHIVPTTQHPNMNTGRTKKFFKPEGSIDLTNYTGSMVKMLKGVDLSKLDVIIDKNQYQNDLTSLFESADITDSEVENVNRILSKYPLANNWTDLFKNANVEFDTPDIEIPGEGTYRDMNLTGMFSGTDVVTDIVIPKNVVNVTSMFENCKSMKEYVKNWDGNYPDLVTEKCYYGSGGDLDFVPVPWGGYGFFPDVTSEIVVNIPKADYTLTLSNRYKTTSYGLVNWGDGTVTNLNENRFQHVYSEPGVYTIKGHFTFGNGYISNTTLSNVLVEVKRIATATRNLSQAFKYCTQLVKVNLNDLDVLNMNECFNGCSKLEEITFNNVETKNMTTTYYAFAGCRALETLDLSTFNTESLLNMESMFYGASNLTTVDLSSFDVSQVTDMSSMFYDCTKLVNLDLSSFVTTNAEDMSYMFNNCMALANLNIDNFVLDNVNNISCMFYGCRNLPNIESLTNWKTSTLTNMSGMFNGCRAMTTINLSSFDTTNVQDMNYLFSGCTGLTSVNISSFDTANVKNMGSMFRDCAKLTQLNVSHFKTDSAEDLSGMFYNCKLLTSIDVSKWNTTNVKDFNSMFYGCNLITSLEVSEFITNMAENMSSMFYECEKLVALNLTKWDTSSVTNFAGMFGNCKFLSTLDLSSFNTGNAKNMANMFNGCILLTDIIIDNTKFDTSKVTNMTAMFRDCDVLRSIDTSKFNTGLVDNMKNMFYGCRSLTNLDLSSFNTQNVTTMSYMFHCCGGIKSLDLGHFNTEKVTDLSYIFYGMGILDNLNLTGWTFDNCEDMRYMFHGCGELKDIDVSNWNVNKVINMASLFHGCKNVKVLDVSNWNTHNVTTMANMFNGCAALTELDLSSFDTTNVETVASMFNGCYCDVTFTNKNTNKLTSAAFMFNVYYGESIDLSGFSLAKSTNNNNFITIAPSLVNFKAPSNITKSINIIAENLSVDSLLSIIDNLSSVAKAQVLYIGQGNIDKLSDEQIAVALNKNWTLM
jgi:surface protein